MNRIERLIWVLQHPTPYNIYLLNQLSLGLDVEIQAVFRYPMLPLHPWRQLPTMTFKARVVENGGRDSTLEALCRDDSRAFVVFGGWRDRTIRRAVFKRIRRKLPFAIWTDTPKTSGGLARWGLNKIFLYIARRAVSVLTTGRPAVEKYLEIGLERSQLKSLPFVVDPAHFRSNRTPSRDDQRSFTVLQVGRLLDELKGQSVAIRALAAARSRAPTVDSRLLLAGTGPDERSLRELASNLGVSEAVRFLGWVDYETLPEHLAASDVLAMPSFQDPYPVAVIEAMTAGLPVLGSDACGSVRDLVVHRVNGMVHPAGDWSTLADHFVILQDSVARARMSEEAASGASRFGARQAVSVVRSLFDNTVAV